MEISYTNTRTGERVVIKNVASWADERSKFDPYILRVIRDKDGKVLAGPMASEVADWQPAVCPECDGAGHHMIMSEFPVPCRTCRGGGVR